MADGVFCAISHNSNCKVTHQPPIFQINFPIKQRKLYEING